MTLEKNIKIGSAIVHKVGFGTARIGGDKSGDGTMFPVYGNETREQQVIQYAIDLTAGSREGLSHIDTAEIYGAGHTEEIIGSAIKKYNRQDLFIATKVGFQPSTSDQILKATEGCLERLQTPYLDMLYLHLQPKDESQLRESLKGLAAAVNRGLTMAIGLSNFNLNGLELAYNTCSVPVVAHQARYNVLSRGLITKPMIEFCQRNNIVLVAHTPLGRGALGEKCDNQVLLDMAEKYKKSPSQIALAWILSQPGIATIPRSHSESHIKSNIEAIEIQLEQADIDRLSGLAN